MGFRSVHPSTERSRIAFVRLLIVALAACGVPRAACGQLNISLPTTLTASPGDTINVPVNLTVIGNQLNTANGNGIGAVSFVISYNSTLTSSVGTFTLGSLISDPTYGFSNYTTNNNAGLIRAVTSSTQGTPGLSMGATGSLATIPFTISPTAAPGSYSLDLLAFSGTTTTSIVDNNFTTYSFGSGLTSTNGSLTVTPVPEPSGLFFVCLSAAAFGARAIRLLGRPRKQCAKDRFEIP